MVGVRCDSSQLAGRCLRKPFGGCGLQLCKNQGTLTTLTRRLGALARDLLHRFHFYRAPVRGMWVRLSDVWRDAIHNRAYDDSAKKLLGEMLAATTIIANNVSHKDRLSLHAVGDGPVKTAFAECLGQEALRGIVRLNEDSPQPINSNYSFKDLLGRGRVALTMQFASGETYQGLVDNTFDRLEQNIEQYFESSEQLNTAFLLSAGGQHVTGCFLQKLPSKDLATDIELAHDEAEWLRLVSLFRTIQPNELIERDVKALLRLVFPSDSIFLDEAKPLAYKCECTRARSATALQTLSHEELLDLVRTEGAVKVTCEFCGQLYEYDEQEIVAGLG